MSIPRELLSPNKRDTPLIGLGQDEYLERHDPSNIIEVDGTYFLWYTEHPPEDGFIGTYVQLATSTDGLHWTVEGTALRAGNPGHWDSKGALTTYVVPWGGSYTMFYTGADGEWDELCCDDANVVRRDGRWWLYYKGRRIGSRPSESQIGVAIADELTGPYRKHPENPLFRGHALSAWVHRSGVAAVEGGVGRPEDRCVLWSEDGIHFVTAGPFNNQSTGFYCPESFGEGTNPNGVTWGVDTDARNRPRYLVRFDCDLKPSDGYANHSRETNRKGRNGSRGDGRRRAAACKQAHFAASGGFDFVTDVSSLVVRSCPSTGEQTKVAYNPVASRV